jgi:ubiquitin-like 1-activating enzyme E1 B
MLTASIADLPSEMAGNIIPAIATTNAIIAGLVVMQAMNLLSHNTSATKNVFLKAEPSKPLGTYLPAPPDPKCAVCRDVYIPFKVNLAKCTLGEFVLDVVGKWLKEGLKGDVNGHGDAEMDEDDDEFETSILEGGRVLADPDFDDNHDRTLADLGVERGKMLTVLDEAEKYRPFHFCICEPYVGVLSSRVALLKLLPVIPRRPGLMSFRQNPPSSRIAPPNPPPALQNPQNRRSSIP